MKNRPSLKRLLLSAKSRFSARSLRPVDHQLRLHEQARRHREELLTQVLDGTGHPTVAQLRQIMLLGKLSKVTAPTPFPRLKLLGLIMAVAIPGLLLTRSGTSEIDLTVTTKAVRVQLHEARNLRLSKISGWSVFKSMIPVRFVAESPAGGPAQSTSRCVDPPSWIESVALHSNSPAASDAAQFGPLDLYPHDELEVATEDLKCAFSVTRGSSYRADENRASLSADVSMPGLSVVTNPPTAPCQLNQGSFSLVPSDTVRFSIIGASSPPTGDIIDAPLRIHELSFERMLDTDVGSLPVRYRSSPLQNGKLVFTELNRQPLEIGSLELLRLQVVEGSLYELGIVEGGIRLRFRGSVSKLLFGPASRDLRPTYLEYWHSHHLLALYASAVAYLCGLLLWVLKNTRAFRVD